MTRRHARAARSVRDGRVPRVRGWPDDGTGATSSASAPEADVEALVAWGRFTDPREALARLDDALPALESGGTAGPSCSPCSAGPCWRGWPARPAADVVEACDLLERAALERRAPVWAACAAALRARAKLDAGDVGSAVNDLARVDLERLGPALAERPGLLLLDTLAGAFARLRLDEQAEDARARFEALIAAACPLDRAVHWSGWSVQLAARALDPVASGRGEPDHAPARARARGQRAGRRPGPARGARAGAPIGPGGRGPRRRLPGPPVRGAAPPRPGRVRRGPRPAAAGTADRRPRGHPRTRPGRLRRDRPQPRRRRRSRTRRACRTSCSRRAARASGCGSRATRAARWCRR